MQQQMVDMQQQMAQIDNNVQMVGLQVRIGRAETANARIITRNSHLQGDLVLAPLQKTVSHQNCLRF
jgi:hypothetical protein